MKISTLIGILVIVGVIFFIYAMMVNESNSVYPTGNINSSSWNGTYDYVSRVDTAVAPIQQSFQDIEESKGWFSFISAGVAGIFRGVTALPTLVFAAFSISGAMFTGFFTAFGLPTYILGAVLVILTVWGLFKLIEIIQRWQI